MVYGTIWGSDRGSHCVDLWWAGPPAGDWAQQWRKAGGPRGSPPVEEPLDLAGAWRWRCSQHPDNTWALLTCPVPPGHSCLFAFSRIEHGLFFKNPKIGNLGFCVKPWEEDNFLLQLLTIPKWTQCLVHSWLTKISAFPSNVRDCLRPTKATVLTQAPDGLV